MKNQKVEKQTKSKQRVAVHGEVFTAEREVNAMLDLVKPETERIDSRFFEPACGNGNFLAEILRRKLVVVKSRYGKNAADYERYAVIAISSIYGVDILPDNVQECQKRLYKIWNDIYTKQCKCDVNDETRAAVRFILKKNILCGDALTLEQADGTPIIFAEWSAINGCLLKRRDFELSQMLHAVDPGLQPDLFGNGGNFKCEASDPFVLRPIREFPPIHYRRVQEND